MQATVKLGEKSEFRKVKTVRQREHGNCWESKEGKREWRQIQRKHKCESDDIT